MTISLTLAVLWALIVNLVAMLPDKGQQTRHGYLLIAVGIPIVGLVTWQHGPWIGMLVLAVGTSVLRWPVVHLGRLFRRKAVR